MTKYAVIEKSTGKMYRGTIEIYDTMEMPINTETLEYAELTDELELALDSSDKLIDTENTKYINGKWDEHYIIVPKVDIYANRLQEMDRLMLEAERMLLIEDLPTSLIASINTYISQLEAIEVTDDEHHNIVWPSKPW